MILIEDPQGYLTIPIWGLLQIIFLENFDAKGFHEISRKTWQFKGLRAVIGWDHVSMCPFCPCQILAWSDWLWPPGALVVLSGCTYDVDNIVILTWVHKPISPWPTVIHILCPHVSISSLDDFIKGLKYLKIPIPFFPGIT